MPDSPNPGDVFRYQILRGEISMNCREAIDVIADFLDEALSRDALDALESHFSDCPPCRAYLRTYRSTRGLVTEVTKVEMPPEMRERLRRFLIQQLSS